MNNGLSRHIAILLLLTAFLQGNELFSQSDTLRQTTDTLPPISKHSPKTASLLSAVVPGLGQAYNRKYYKIPLIYAAFGTVGYFVWQNNSYYQEFKTAYSYRTDNDSLTIDKYTNYSAANLLTLKDYHRRNLELTVIIGTVIYILNIVDASVDAHLFDFDVSDKLSMRVAPSLHPSFARAGMVPAVSIQLNLRQ
jgi:hypothetical protein